MRAFVTGGTGLLGKALTARLLKDGHEVVMLVRDRIPAMHVDGSIVVSGDILDLPILSRTVSEYRIEKVFHLAGQTTVHPALANPVNTFEVNVRGTWNVLDAVRTSAPNAHVLVASSDKVYGDGPCPYVETMPMKGLYPYDASKTCADIIARGYTATYGTAVTVVRCSNLYGPGDLNWDRLIPGFMRFAFKGDEFTLRGGGSMKRDFMYVEDAVEGYLLAANTPEWIGQAVNFGTGEPVSISFVIGMMLQMTGCSRSFKTVESSHHETTAQWMNTALADSKGWLPAHTLVSGLEKTVEWYRGYLDKSGWNPHFVETGIFHEEK